MPPLDIPTNFVIIEGGHRKLWQFRLFKDIVIVFISHSEGRFATKFHSSNLQWLYRCYRTFQTQTRRLNFWFVSDVAGEGSCSWCSLYFRVPTVCFMGGQHSQHSKHQFSQSYEDTWNDLMHHSCPFYWAFSIHNQILDHAIAKSTSKQNLRPSMAFSGGHEKAAYIDQLYKVMCHKLRMWSDSHRMWKYHRHFKFLCMDYTTWQWTLTGSMHIGLQRASRIAPLRQKATKRAV